MRTELDEAKHSMHLVYNPKPFTLRQGELKKGRLNGWSAYPIDNF